MTGDVLDLYREVASGGVGLIITGDFSVVPPGLLDEGVSGERGCTYDGMRIEGFERLPQEVRAVAPSCKIVAQISGGYPGAGPSDIPSPFTRERTRPLSKDEIGTTVQCFVTAIAGLKEDGFDGVQLHAAHGGMLSRFLSPYTNRRQDEYGGSVQSRARIVREIVSGARQKVADFPILIKMNGTDYLEGGTDINSFPDLASEIERCGFDAIEVSGGMWDCLVRTEEELGFRPVPAAESHTRIRRPERQSYFLKYAESLTLTIPVILVGGNRDIERVEAIVREGRADFIALCRPFISEPRLPHRWLEGLGSSGTDCISCNSCLYDMWDHVERSDPWFTRCLLKSDRPRVKFAQQWLSTWVERNVVADDGETRYA
jgi:2,4-dienoyl-CoA reductase-like NADH-dependent reductase (Old Yellow Enzyme family)